MSSLDSLIAAAPAAARPGNAGIVLDRLAKTYADGTEALHGISTEISPGEAYGILGPNGAGKSTTIGILGTLIRPSAGSASVAGFDVVSDPVEVRRRIGFAMQSAGVDEFATPLELLVLQARLHGIASSDAHARAELLLDAIDLSDARDKRLGGFSGGMKRRVDLAAALIHLPPVLFLDEPSEGLDPRSRGAIWDMLDELRRLLGVTLVLTTHFMDEAERLCGRIGIIDRGRLLVEGTPAELKQAAGGATVSLEEAYLHHTGRPLDEERDAEVAIGVAA